MKNIAELEIKKFYEGFDLEKHAKTRKHTELQKVIAFLKEIKRAKQLAKINKVDIQFKIETDIKKDVRRNWLILTK